MNYEDAVSAKHRIFIIQTQQIVKKPILRLFCDRAPSQVMYGAGNKKEIAKDVFWVRCSVQQELTTKGTTPASTYRSNYASDNGLFIAGGRYDSFEATEKRSQIWQANKHK